MVSICSSFISRMNSSFNGNPIQLYTTETLRIYPPVPMLNRICSKRWPIPNSEGRFIEPNTAILIPLHAMQTDPKYYPDPQRFDPERFRPERLAGKSFAEHPYMPFGEGPRNCIGLRMGKMQTKVSMIVMLQRYSYELAGNTKLPLVMVASSIIMAPEGGINLRITHRK